MHHHDAHQMSANQDLVGSGSTTLNEAISMQQAQLSGGGHAAHMDGDSGMVADHSQLLNLFPEAGDSGVAVALNGGSWFDPGTWSTGKVPRDGEDVYIPFGVSVVVDGESNARLDTVGVDGGLHFAVDVDTKLTLDTLVTGPQSTFTMGVEENPVQKGVSAQIVIHTDNGAVGGADDPTELGRGVITHGKTEIVGQDKSDYLNVLTPPEAGDNSLVFSEFPVGWEVGDKLVVAGVRLAGDNEFEDEIVTVKSIQNNGDGTYTVNLNQTLQYDHVPPKAADGNAFQVPVANYTRNVSIGTETDGDQYLSDGKTVDIDERGHVMFMHNDDVVVKNAEFFELGRTDKQQMLDADDNVAGRYALHFHRTGVDDIENPALAEGNAVWGSPGWGIVHHDANLDVISNAVFGVNGGGIIAEAGNETGIWAGNITIQTTGDYTTHNSEHSGAEDHPAGRQQLLDDSFTQGIGYGFKSRLILTADNVAVSSNGAGYSYWPMGTEGGSPSHIKPLVENFVAIYGYDPFFGQDDERISEIPNRTFFNNTTMVSHVGFNTSADKRGSKTDAPTVIDGFTAWEVGQGFGGFYQHDYLVKDSYFYGLEDGWLNGLVQHAPGDNTTGIMAREFHELKLVNNTFENFDIGIFEQNHETGKEWIHVILGNEFLYVEEEILLDVDNAGSNQNYVVNDNSDDWADNLNIGFLDAEVKVSQSDLVMTKFFDRFNVVVEKTDTLGTKELDFGSVKGRNGGASQKTWWQENSVNKGYYVEDGKYYLVVDIIVSDRVTGSLGVISVPIELAFVENAGDLPSGAVNLGSLPGGLFEFEMIDQRILGEVGNQLNPVDLDAATTTDDGSHTGHDGGHTGGDHTGGTDGNTDDNGGHTGGDHMGGTDGNGGTGTGGTGDDGGHSGGDHMGGSDDNGGTGTGDSGGTGDDGGHSGDDDHSGGMDDMGGNTGGGSGSGSGNIPDDVILLEEAVLNGGTHSAVTVSSDAVDLTGATGLSLSFNTNKLTGIPGIINKDNDGELDGDNHMSAFIRKGTLVVQFQHDGRVVSFEEAGIEANRTYDLDIVMNGSFVSVSLDDEMLGSLDDFGMTFTDMPDDWVIGAQRGNSVGGDTPYHRIFDGEITDVAITYQAFQNDGSGGDNGNGGTPADDVIVGTDGEDSLDGGAGADSIEGGRGDDTMEGGSGNDTLTGGRDNDSVSGGDGDDNINGNRSADTLDGGDGDDFIQGGGGADVINGGAGNDNVIGGARGDSIDGGAGNDSLSGDAGSDFIDGGADNDTISGGGDSDFLIGGTGDDELTGGDGRDWFYFDEGHGSDIVVDLEIGVDTVMISGDLAAGRDASTLVSLGSVVGGDFVLNTSDQSTITFEGITSADSLDDMIIIL